MLSLNSIFCSERESFKFKINQGRRWESEFGWLSKAGHYADRSGWKPELSNNFERQCFMWKETAVTFQRWHHITDRSTEDSFVHRAPPNNWVGSNMSFLPSVLHKIRTVQFQSFEATSQNKGTERETSSQCMQCLWTGTRLKRLYRNGCEYEKLRYIKVRHGQLPYINTANQRT